MNNYRVAYEERKQTVIDLLQQAKTVCQKYNQEKKEEIYESLINSVKSEEFSIVVVGEFSAGKSTFLNSLMGEKILPSFTNETTATVNFLRHKDRGKDNEAGKVFYSDGREETLNDLEATTISRFVSTRSDLKVADSVEHLDLYLESKFLEGNVTLVDSPGLNGTADGHRDITEAQIAKSSASIFMFRAEQPGSKSDFEFLKQLKDKVNTIIFVLNKIDDIKAHEGETVESVIDSLKANYKKHFPEETTIPEIWGLSSYQALVARSSKNLDYRDRMDYTKEEKELLLKKSGMCEFENRLWQFLTKGEKAREQLLEPARRVISLLSSEIKTLMKEKETLESKNDSEEVLENIVELDKQVNEMNKSMEAIVVTVQGQLTTLERDIKESIGGKFESTKNREIRKLEMWNDISALEQLEENLDKQVEKSFAKIIQEIEEEFQQGLFEIVTKNYSHMAHEINDKLDDLNFSLSLDLKYQPTESGFTIGIEKYEREIKNAEGKINEIYSKLDETEVSKIKRVSLEREKEKLENQLERTRMTKKAYEQSMTPPKVHRYTETEVRKSDNKGALVLVKNVLFGRKEIQVPVTKTDDSELLVWKESVKIHQEQFDEEIKSFNNKINDFKLSGKSSDELEIEQKQQLRKLNELERELNEKRKAFKEEYLKKNETLIRAKKVAIEDYYDEYSDEYRKEVTKALRENKKIFAEMIKTVITNELQKGLEEKKRELEMLNQKLSSSQQDKVKYLEEMDNRISDMRAIVSEAIGLVSDLESEEVNIIEKISL